MFLLIFVFGHANPISQNVVSSILFSLFLFVEILDVLYKPAYETSVMKPPLLSLAE